MSARRSPPSDRPAVITGPPPFSQTPLPIEDPLKHVLGVDGGGTKTTARVLALGADGRLCLLASAHAGGSNPLSVGWDAAQAAIESAVNAAASSAGVALDAGVLAIAGCASAAAHQRLETWAQAQRFAKLLKVVPDTEPLLADVPAGETAIGLIAGTGSSALVRKPDGSTEVVGGWGYLVDDAGSGYALGRDALRHIAQRWDRGEASDAITEAVLQQAGVASPPSLKGALYGAADPRGWAAQLALVVLRLAGAGDGVAKGIIDANAAALASLASHARSRLGGGERPRVLVAGGVANGSRLYRHLLVEKLVEQGWPRDHVTLAGDAACACGLLAMRLASQR